MNRSECLAELVDDPRDHIRRPDYNGDQAPQAAQGMAQGGK
jgi:hypothetical protein